MPLNLLDAIKQALIQEQQSQQPPPMSMMPNMPQANGTPPFVPSNRPMPMQNPMPQGQGDQGSGFGEFLRTLGLPLVSTVAGLASQKMLPGAAGFNQGYPAGRQQAFENKITKREQDRRDSVSSGLSEAPEGFEIVGYDQKGQPMIRKPKGSPTLEKFRQQRGIEINKEIEQNKVTKDSIAAALDAATKITPGRAGKIKRGIMKEFDANNPELGEWQKVKSVLTDAQLMSSLALKGAISDVENKWLAEAAANDDFASLPAIQVVLDRAVRKLDASEKGLTEAYRNDYGEDPYESDSSGSQSTPSFTSEQEAIKANLPPGTQIMINGRPAVWE